MLADFDSLGAKGVFITGGATGIGAAMVKTFIDSGAKVAFNDINGDVGEALASHYGEMCHFFPADASDPEALGRSVKAGIATLGRLDVLVNNVANDQREAIDAISPDSWRAGLAVNLDPVMFATEAAVPALRKQGGSIINFSSLNALLGPAELATYTAANAAIIGLTKSMANGYGIDRVRVNAIVPGWVSTQKQKATWLTPEAQSAWMEQCALKDEILPQDVANLALFLASHASRMITGQSFVIDAGRT